MTQLCRMFGATLALALFSAVPALADERVTLDQVPPAVKATIEKHVADGKIEYIERDEERGKIRYEVDFEDRNGRDYELLVAEDGTLLFKHRDR